MIAARATEGTARRCALLARLLAEALVAGVQNTAALNLAAARALLTQARLAWPPALERQGDIWQWSWRSFRTTAASVDQLLQLTRAHADRGTGSLWHLAERLLGEMAQARGEQLQALAASFERLRDAQAAHWRAAQQANEALLQLALQQIRMDDDEDDRDGQDQRQ